MAKKVVIFIQSDPRATAYPSEAIRIALGLSGHHVVELIFSPAASLLLGDGGGSDLADAEAVQSYLPLLQEQIGLFYIASEAETAAAPGAYKTACVTPSEMAQKIAVADCFMLF